MSRGQTAQASARSMDGTSSSSGRASAWFEKLVTIVILAVLAAAGALVCLVAAGLIDPAVLIGDQLVRERLLGFADGPWTTRLAVIGIGAAVGIISTGLLIGRFRRGSSSVRSSQHILEMDDRGLVTVSAEAVAVIAETAALRTRSVVDATVRIRGRDRGPVQVRVDALALAGADMPRVGNEVRERTRQAVESMAGMEVSDVSVHLDIAPPQRWMELS